MNEDLRSHEWQALYDALHSALASRGAEDACGKGDYWLVDDDYGDTTQKLCVFRPSLLEPSLIPLFQKTLGTYSHWRLMVQLEVQVDGVLDTSNGFVVYSNKVEPHWVSDADVFVDLRKRLHL
ncbi:MAG TPA: hypothetical protein VN280_06295 [Variovorax sp.]|nr:hypothetical protein [Variovorax sp.]